MNEVKREANYDLLRIIVMYCVVIYHFIVHGYVIENTGGLTQFVAVFIKCITFFSVHVFVLITGYYQVKSKFKVKKLLSLFMQVWFYMILVTLVLYLTGLVSFSITDLFINMNPLSLNNYWFMGCYFILYVISPFINNYLSKIDRGTYKKLIITLLLCFSILPFITNLLSYNTLGNTVYQFIILYLIGAYFRMYNIPEKILGQFNNSQKRLIFAIGFIVNTLIVMGIYYMTKHIESINNGFTIWYTASFSAFLYNNPFVLMQSIFAFLFFGTIHFENKFISNIAPLVFGIYLLTDNNNIRVPLYHLLKIDVGHTVGIEVIIGCISASILLFIIAMCIEKLRTILFKYIYKLNFVKKIESSIINLFNNLSDIK